VGAALGTAVDTTGGRVGMTGTTRVAANEAPAEKTILASAIPTDVMMGFMSFLLAPRRRPPRMCGKPAGFAFQRCGDAAAKKTTGKRIAPPIA
jgi:hypothetical protein